MKIIHTSDWHLGHMLHDHGREAEHRAFLGWLLDTLESEAVDALLICGDIFDSANPSALAQGMWYRFLVEAQQRVPNLDIVAIGGNHDSAARLDAPDLLLRAFRARVIGGLPYAEDGTVEWEKLIVPLHDATGEVAAWVVAVPFLRQADLPPLIAECDDPLISGVRERYAEATALAVAQCGAEQALLLTGHCYMTGGVISDLSERKILGGNQHALPADIFPPEVAYVALGHLHRPQSVAGRENVRYCGSPLPLSVSEISYKSQVCLVELHRNECTSVTPLVVPRSVEFMRIPASGELPLDALIAELSRLPEANPGEESATFPYLEVAPLLDKPEPAMRERIQNALNGKKARLIRIAPPVYSGEAAASVTALSGQSLSEITPEDVFIRRYGNLFNGPPPAEYLSAFHELIDQAGQMEARQ